MKYVSIHALVKRATSTKERLGKNFDVSIHALVKRATFLQLYTGRHLRVSIHALVKRATGDDVNTFAFFKFQSTPS